jgi:predicted  nucleic acid-binding Zn-ribbon protein
MDEVDRLLRHLEEVAEEIQALRFRLSYLEDHRAEIRESIKVAASRPRDNQQALALFKARHPSKPQIKHKRGAAMSLRQAADAVTAMRGDVDAHD